MAKNVLLIMTDQQRADTFNAEIMPNLFALSSTTKFSCCQTGNPICSPARSSLITGRYSSQIGMLTMSGDLFPQIPTFLQVLQRQGYTNYGVGKFHYLQTPPWDVPIGKGLNFPEMYKSGNDSRLFGYDEAFEVAGKQMMQTNYCYYAQHLEQKGLLDDVRRFWRESGGKNGDTADHNYDLANAWQFDEKDYVDVVIGDKAVEILSKHDERKPFLLHLSFCGPHKPYDAPHRYLELFPEESEDDFVLDGDKKLNESEKATIYRQRRSVKAMLRCIDDQIGRVIELLKKRGLFDDTLIVFTSDHGDMLGDHYMIQKGVPWKQALNVPLLVRYPNATIEECDSPIELSDIAASILDYIGANKSLLERSWPSYNDRIPSRSFLPIVRGECSSIRDFAYSESDFTEERGEGSDIRDTIAKRGIGRTNAWQCITTATSKYIRYASIDDNAPPHEEYYDLIKDTDELRNVVDLIEYSKDVQVARERLSHIVDYYKPCQMVWAKY